MNELLQDRAMSCAVANLKLIKALSQLDGGEARALTAAAADCSQHCLICVHGCETGTVLPETMDRWCDACQHLQNLIGDSLLELVELSACADACESCIKTCNRQSA